MMKIKTQMKNITPAWAEKVLSEANKRIEKGEFRNRRISERAVMVLTAVMKKGQWMPSHQGIAFDVNGNLLDGQHRLWAVVRSGCTVPMLVTTGLPEGAGRIKTMDVIDVGKPRGVRQALIISHGYPDKEAGVYAACTRHMAQFITKMSFTYRTEMCLDMLQIYEGHLKAVMNCIPNVQKVAKMPIGMLAFYHASNPQDAILFADQLYRGEGLKSTDPAYAYARYHANTTGRNTGAHVQRAAMVLAQCLYHHAHGQQIGHLKPAHYALDWLIDLQPKNTKRIFGIVGPADYSIEEGSKKAKQKEASE